MFAPAPVFSGDANMPGLPVVTDQIPEGIFVFIQRRKRNYRETRSVSGPTVTSSVNRVFEKTCHEDSQSSYDGGPGTSTALNVPSGCCRWFRNFMKVFHYLL